MKNKNERGNNSFNTKSNNAFLGLAVNLRFDIRIRYNILFRSTCILLRDRCFCNMS